jgi:stage V sporulation protein S
MRLTELINKFETEIHGDSDIEISGIAYDSRKVKPGYLFIAIKGYETDGHKYIDSAVANGAVAVIGEDCVECGCTYVKVKDSRKAMALCGAAYYGNPQDKIKIIGGKQMEVLKISSKSNPNSVAGAIAGLVKESTRAEMQAIGAGALNQAIKAVAIARGFVAPAGVDLICIPAFAEVQVEGEDRTGIKLIIESRK